MTLHVIPAKAGIHSRIDLHLAGRAPADGWIPAYAGMT
jgi:hypothetical protein